MLRGGRTGGGGGALSARGSAQAARRVLPMITVRNGRTQCVDPSLESHRALALPPATNGSYFNAEIRAQTSTHRHVDRLRGSVRPDRCARARCCWAVQYAAPVHTDAAARRAAAGGPPDKNRNLPPLPPARRAAGPGSRTGTQPKPARRASSSRSRRPGSAARPRKRPATTWCHGATRTRSTGRSAASAIGSGRSPPNTR